jgi:hypothetical protein
VLPLVFGLVWYGLVFSALNAALLRIRIRAEEAALVGLATPSATTSRAYKYASRLFEIHSCAPETLSLRNLIGATLAALWFERCSEALS